MIELEEIFSLINVQKKLLRETAAGNTEEGHGYLKRCRPHEISSVPVMARDPVLVRSKRRVASFGSIHSIHLTYQATLHMPAMSRSRRAIMGLDQRQICSLDCLNECDRSSYLPLESLSPCFAVAIPFTS